MHGPESDRSGLSSRCYLDRIRVYDTVRIVSSAKSPTGWTSQKARPWKTVAVRARRQAQRLFMFKLSLRAPVAVRYTFLDRRYRGEATLVIPVEEKPKARQKRAPTPQAVTIPQAAPRVPLKKTRTAKLTCC